MGDAKWSGKGENQWKMRQRCPQEPLCRPGGLDPGLEAPEEGSWWSPLPRLTPPRPAPGQPSPVQQTWAVSASPLPCPPSLRAAAPGGCREGPQLLQAAEPTPPPQELREDEYFGGDVKKGKKERRRKKKQPRTPSRTCCTNTTWYRTGAGLTPAAPCPATLAGPVPGPRTHSCGIPSPPAPATRSVVENRGCC